ncbi:hypothetical protein TONV_036 [Tipula oleracea nudivirus]|uniref:Uncharacterized protein n=1 Tax=Tipula oleracea nudivirus TaxID=1546257 RepID=A0A0B4VG49_9VIRU|nr:hypothetical protein TONV_036 [Tipula oleracea nudivirus]AJD20096.1 hypothetical protein TONV_036 [Tipula oleracea nudivirus]
MIFTYFLHSWKTQLKKKSYQKYGHRGLNPGPSACKTDAITTRPYPPDSYVMTQPLNKLQTIRYKKI